MNIKNILCAACAAMLCAALCAGCASNAETAAEEAASAEQSENIFEEAVNSIETAETAEEAELEAAAVQDDTDPQHTQQIYLGDFTAQTLDGGEFTQKNIAEYDVTIINFWGTTCPPCINEMPDIAKLQQKLEEEGSNVALITFCLDGTTSPDTCKAILDNAGYTGITLVSSDGVLGELAASVMYIPTTVFFYSDGLAALSLIGGQTDIEGEYMARADAMLDAGES